MNVVVLGLPDEGESLECPCTDAEKLNRVWDKMGVAGVDYQHNRLDVNVLSSSPYGTRTHVH